MGISEGTSLGTVILHKLVVRTLLLAEAEKVLGLALTQN